MKTSIACEILYLFNDITGGKLGMWIVSGTGLICCSLAVLIGFVPPTQIPIDNLAFFEAFLCGGLVLFVAIPWFLAKKMGNKLSVSCRAYVPF